MQTLNRGADTSQGLSDGDAFAFLHLMSSSLLFFCPDSSILTSDSTGDATQFMSRTFLSLLMVLLERLLWAQKKPFDDATPLLLKNKNFSVFPQCPRDEILIP